MSYQSVGFLLFSAGVLVLYYLLGRKRQKWVLAAANLVFYAIAGLQYLPFLLVTMLTTYAVGRVIGSIYERADAALPACTTAAEKKQVKADAKGKAKRALRWGLVVTIALLAVCKYVPFIITNLNGLLSLFRIPAIPVFRLILPLGISFYSFMAISYILDVYWKRYSPEKDFLNYAVYLSYFPHIVQGPIDRFNEFRDQINSGVVFNPKNLMFGAELLLWGLFKKLVIADRLNLFVSYVFDHWQENSGAILFLAVMIYSVQIYADFSGCIDIVTGVSEMFGIRLRKNFNHPFFSRSLAEFWRRWHISLQEWLKDYVYYPVFASGMMRRVKKRLTGKGRTRAAELFSSCFPILVVWLITGIWHGASWNFVLWGLFHASLLIGSQVLEPFFIKVREKLGIVGEGGRLWHLWQMIRTFLLCGLGRIFFRTADIHSAFGYIGRMFTHLFDKPVLSLEFTNAAGTVSRLWRSSMSKLFQELRRMISSPGSFGLSQGITGLYQDFRTMLNADIGFNISLANILMSVIVIAVLWIVDVRQEKKSLREALARKRLPVRWLVIYIGIFAVIIFGIYGPGYDASSFIYERF